MIAARCIEWRSAWTTRIRPRPFFYRVSRMTQTLAAPFQLGEGAIVGFTLLLICLAAIVLYFALLARFTSAMQYANQ